MSTIDRDVSALKAMRDEVATVSSQNARACADLERVMQKCESLENQSRRNNVLFFNLPDIRGETWAQSEESVIAFCEERLGVTISPPAIELAQRLGPFHGGQACPRPIIVKFSSFKEKEVILSKTFRLKETGFRLRDDYSVDVRKAKKELVTFAKSKGQDFKLLPDKLIIGNVKYVYGKQSSSVKTLPV